VKAEGVMQYLGGEESIEKQYVWRKTAISGESGSGVSLGSNERETQPKAKAGLMSKTKPACGRRVSAAAMAASAWRSRAAGEAKAIVIESISVSLSI
jgi:hypothetical protein